MRLNLLAIVPSLLAVNASAFAAQVDTASAIRGSLGASLEELSLNTHLGSLVFFLNGGFAILCGIFACFAIARRRRQRRQPMKSPHFFGQARAADHHTGSY